MYNKSEESDYSKQTVGPRNLRTGYTTGSTAAAAGSTAAGASPPPAKKANFGQMLAAQRPAVQQEEEWDVYYRMCDDVHFLGQATRVRLSLSGSEYLPPPCANLGTLFPILEPHGRRWPVARAESGAPSMAPRRPRSARMRALVSQVLSQTDSNY